MLANISLYISLKVFGWENKISKFLKVGSFLAVLSFYISKHFFGILKLFETLV